MTYLITQSCCNDTACVAVCPVNCIHPTADEPDYATAEMLYIDPAVCIDCGACMDVCPVRAIYPDWEVPEHLQTYLDVNAEYYQDPAHADYVQSRLSTPHGSSLASRAGRCAWRSLGRDPQASTQQTRSSASVG